MSDKEILEGNKYFNIHQWIKRHYGKADKCENPKCKSINSKRFEWALLNGKQHDRNINNYIQLCSSCHKIYDMTDSKRANMSKAKLSGTANDISVISIHIDGTITKYRSISEAYRITRVGVQTIYDSIRNKPKKWKRKETKLTWRLATT